MLKHYRASASSFYSQRQRLLQAWAQDASHTLYSEADLIVVNNAIYHLAIDGVAPNIILVGDPNRVKLIARDFLKTCENVFEHRGLITVTGESKETGQRLSLVTSGMGTASEEIVLNELFAINNLSLTTRRRKADFAQLTIIRVGTSGGIQETTPLGTPVITEYAVGLDNTGPFYDIPYADECCREIERRVDAAILTAQQKTSRFYGKIHSYVSRAEPSTIAALEEAAQQSGIPARLGITVTNDGFFANQGRAVSPLPLSVPHIDRLFSALDTGTPYKVENFEMESSFLFHYMLGVGMRAGTVCATLADRSRNIFAKKPEEAIRNAVTIAIKAHAKLA